MSDGADVVVTYLELRPGTTDRSVSAASARPFTLHRVLPPEAAPASAALYARVGGPWHWTDRLGWTAAEWHRAVNRDDVELWVARTDGATVGYFQLELDGAAVELKYFGLVPECIGRGLGGPLLSAAIERAWALGKERVTLSTCSLDHPAALGNYLRHGFVVLRTERQRQGSSA